jgi:hypothetical protein
MVNPNDPLPDLHPIGVTIQFQPDGTAFDFAYLIRNSGDGAAQGGFQIGLAVEYYDHSQDPPLLVDRSELFTFPDYIFFEPGDIRPSDYFRNVPFRPHKGDSEYPKVAYSFYCTVDVNDQITESNKSNNSVETPMTIGLPVIILPGDSGVFKQ